MTQGRPSVNASATRATSSQAKSRPSYAREKETGTGPVHGTGLVRWDWNVSDLVFDSRWFTKRFPLAAVPRSEWCGGFVSTPESLVMIEQIRALANAPDLGPRILCDVFVLGSGEPPEPSVTKIAGRPFRPFSRAWPVGNQGRPMTFVVQFNFCGSGDIVGTLPGDVLLVFAADDDICSDDPQEKLHFEWYPVDINERLLCSEEMLETAWSIRPSYGVRYRTCDYAGRRAWDALLRVLDPDKVTQQGVEGITSGLDRLCALKIGGLPVSRRGGKYKDPSPWGGSFLASASTAWPSLGRPFPWINQESPIPLDEARNLWNWLNIRDSFVLEFYLQEDGSIKWWIQFG